MCWLTQNVMTQMLHPYAHPLPIPDYPLPINNSLLPVPDPSIQTLTTAIDEADSPERLIGAVQALAAARSPEGIPTLIRALGFNNPGAAVVAMRGLIQMGQVAVEPLLNLMDDYNYGARAYTIRALAAIADPRALEVLLSAAETDFAPSVRRAATKGIGMLRWVQLPEAERAVPSELCQAQNAQSRVLQSLTIISSDSDWSLRYAAVVGLQSLAESSRLKRDIITHLVHMVETETDSAVVERIRWAMLALSDSPENPSLPPSTVSPWIPQPTA